MDLAASAAISVVNKVIVALQNVKWNKHQCTRLAEQWQRLETALTNARRDLGQSHINALRATEALGRATIDFIAKYATKGFLGRLWKVTSDKERIEDLCQRLSSLLQELQMGICGYECLPPGTPRGPCLGCHGDTSAAGWASTACRWAG